MKTRNMKIGMALLLLVSGCLVLSRPALANDDGAIAVGGEFLFKIKAAAEGKSVKERAAQVEERLVPILSETQVHAADIRLEPIGKVKIVKKGKKKISSPEKVRIFVKNHFLINVTPEDGKANGSTAIEQAQVWAAQLRKVLPRVNIKPNPNDRR